MKKLLLIASLCLFSINSFSNECDTRSENTKYESLRWFTASEVIIESSVKNLRGSFCIGFSESKEIKRVHYFDDAGNTILKDARELYNRDTIFFSKNILPDVVKPIARKEDPLSLRVVKISKFKNQFKLKLVENMMKGFSRTKIREILIHMDYSAERPIFKHKGLEFDELSIHVSNMMRIKKIGTYLNGRKNQTYKMSTLKSCSRKF